MRKYSILLALILTVSVCFLSGCPVDPSAADGKIVATDANGNLLPTLTVTSVDDGTIDVAIDEGDYQCLDGYWTDIPHDTLGYEPSFVIAFVLDGETYFWEDVKPGEVINFLKPDYIAVGWLGHYSGEDYSCRVVWFDNSKLVATFDGKAMGYNAYYWCLI